MEQENLYETIFRRKSIRKFDLRSLNRKLLADITLYIEKTVPLNPEIETEIRIVSAEDVKGLIQVKAPHFIIAFSEVKEGFLTNIGFRLQQLDLVLSANGIGCCWQGWPKPTKELRNNRNLEFIIVLAFGLPAEKLHRESVHEFKRKSLDQIKDINGFDELLDAARLAPSPSQPWFFSGDTNTIHIFCKKTGGLLQKISRSLNTMENKLNRIEIGIAACHLWIAALHFNRRIDFSTQTIRNVKIPEDYFFIISVNIQKPDFTSDEVLL